MDAKPKHGSPYRSLSLMAVLSFASMYVLMYAMVNSPANVYANVNQLYMAGLMTAPMVLIELVLMRSMYPSRRLNGAVAAVAVVAVIGCFVLIRRQTGVGNEQFLKSMIPHHASALLMCRQAPVDDPAIEDLCRRILSGQQAEIDEMKAKLGQLE
jgi:hypothetical protein